MKKLALFCSFAAILTVNAKVSSTNTVKVFDGQRAYCNKKSDVFRYRMQAYKINKLVIKNSDNLLNLNLDLTMLECKADGEGNNPYYFSKVNAFDSFSYDVLTGVNDDGSRVFNHVEANTSDVKLKVYQDGKYKLLRDIRVESDKNAQLNFDTTLEVSDLLNIDQQNSLENGEMVKTAFDFMMTRNLVLSSKSNEFKSTQKYGAFRVHLVLKKVNNEIKVFSKYSK